MKKLFAIFAIGVLTVNNLSAQTQTFEKSAEGEQSLQAYKENQLHRMPEVQAYQVTKGPQAGTILKAANCTGFYIGAGAGVAITDDNTFSPAVQVSGGYDGKRFSYEVTISAMYRRYNAEADDAGENFISPMSDFKLKWVALKNAHRTWLLTPYVSAGYAFYKHKVTFDKLELPEGTTGTFVNSVYQNGSGVTCGAGLELQHNFYATGNAVSVYLGVKQVPKTYLNNTESRVMIEAGLSFKFGTNRARYRANK